MFDELSKQIDMCSACPSLCQSACPVFQNDANKSHSPWGMMQVLGRVERSEMPFDASIAKMSYHCLTCRACTEQCEHNIDIAGILHHTRNLAVQNEIAPPEMHGFLEKFHRHNNPFSKDLLDKLSKLLPEKIFKKNSPTAYFASCTTIAKAPEVITDTFSLFEKLKIDFVSPYTDPIQCCGYPLYSAGAEYDFIDIAEINYHSLKSKKLIITGSPACAHTLKNTYARYDFNLEGQVMTINEFLKPYLKNINYKLKKTLRSKLLYHDPCYLSRYLGEIDLPREMISQMSGEAPMEFHDHGKCSSCSGQGGCYSIIEKEKADQITQSRLSECHEKKVNLVVTQCPTCLHKMRKNSKSLIIKDLISYLNDCIEGVIE